MTTMIEQLDAGRGADNVTYGYETVREFDGRTHECRAVLCPENDGFTVYAKRLPGVVSQADTEDEAWANIADAFREAMRTYMDLSIDIPWEDVDVPKVAKSKERWILVDV